MHFQSLNVSEIKRVKGKYNEPTPNIIFKKLFQDFCMQFVFCVHFLCSLIPLKKTSLNWVCQSICSNFYHFKDTREQRGQRPTLCIFSSTLILLRFISFRHTYSWKKINKYQTWFNNVHVWDLLILVIVHVLCVLQNEYKFTIRTKRKRRKNANETNEKRTNASHERYTKRTHDTRTKEMKRTNYTENANERTHDTRTNESLERSHILFNDKRSWFYRSTIYYCVIIWINSVQIDVIN